MKVYENTVADSFSAPENTTIVFRGAENVRVCVNEMQNGLPTDPSCLFLVLVMLFKNSSTLQPSEKGMKVTTVSTASSRDGVIPFLVEDELDPVKKTAIRQIRSCELSHELIVSSLPSDEAAAVMDIIRVFNSLFSSVLLKSGPPDFFYRPFDNWRQLLKSRFGLGLNQINVELVQSTAGSTIKDLSDHYTHSKWWGDDLGIMDIAIASYIHSFSLMSNPEFYIADQSLIHLKDRVLAHFK